MIKIEKYTKKTRTHSAYNIYYILPIVQKTGTTFKKCTWMTEINIYI